MTCWTALVPVKSGPDCKSRLAAVLTPAHRLDLVEQMAAHVIAELSKVPGVTIRVIPDRGGGLNQDLDRAAWSIDGPVLAIHADLPLVQAQEIADLLGAAQEGGFALAPDRHGTGTNALALLRVPLGFAFAFGPESRAAHRLALGTSLTTLERKGLAFDLDTPEDLALLRARDQLPDGR